MSKLTPGRFREQALQYLASDSLLPFIEWLDNLYAASYSDHESLLRECLARLTIAVGTTLVVEPDSSISRTLAAAERYLAEPDSVTWQTFFKACTNSYPLGPGDGCYGVEELGHGPCGAGSGCRSGVGFLYFAGPDQPRIFQAVRSSMTDWGV